ncbi:MAG TPA: hypothetical protein DCW40_04080 [Rikenellaceae bacterium]|nr:hypothetical protein [Rikenellaceae bacterium]
MKAKYLVCGLLTAVMCACGGNGTGEKNGSTAKDSSVQAEQMVPEASEEDPTAISYEVKFDSEYFSDAKVTMAQSELFKNTIVATFTLTVRKAIPEGKDENILVSPLKGERPEGVINVGVDKLAKDDESVFENEPGKTIQFTWDFTKEKLEGVSGFLVKTSLTNPDSAFETAE